MVRYTLDQETCRQLGAATQTIELCDHEGHVIGFFLPEGTPRGLPPAGLKIPLTADEIERRRTRSGRTLDQILQDLGPK
jgi:hypothetical protein